MNTNQEKINQYLEKNQDKPDIKALISQEIFSTLNMNIHVDKKGRLILDLGELFLNFGGKPSERRNTIDSSFKKNLIKLMFFLNKKYQFYSMTFLNFIFETIKNIADRTDSDGYFGLKIAISQDAQMIKIFVMIGDNGEGIEKTMQNPDKKSNSEKNCGAGFDMFCRNFHKDGGFEKGHSKLHLYDNENLFTLAIPDLSNEDWKYFEDIDWEAKPWKTLYVGEVVIKRNSEK